MLENENEVRVPSEGEASENSTEVKMTENGVFDISGGEAQKEKEPQDGFHISGVEEPRESAPAADLTEDKKKTEPATYAFEWDHRTQHERETAEQKRTNRRNGLYAGLIIVAVFSLLIAVLAILLAIGSYRALARYEGGSGGGGFFERVVYVSAGDDNEEELAVEAAVARVLPSTASILVSKENGGSGVGSGVVYSKDGLILTNCHVVSGASSVRVRLYGGAEYAATVVGKDEQSDLALLKIEAENLTPATFGASEDLLVGETVMTIGTPTGISFSESVSRGIVSSVRRAVKIYDNTGRLQHTLLMVQTDASVNPGNSGGALLDRKGEVVGIVSNKTVFYDNGTAYYADGMGLAIPSEAAVSIAEDLRVGKAPDRSAFTIPASRLGITGQYDVTLGGIVVKDFTSDRFDASRKLLVGDVITAVNGKALSDIDGLLRAIEDYAPGATVRLTVKRDGKTVSVDLILGSDALA